MAVGKKAWPATVRELAVARLEKKESRTSGQVFVDKTCSKTSLVKNKSAPYKTFSILVIFPTLILSSIAGTERSESTCSHGKKLSRTIH